MSDARRRVVTWPAPAPGVPPPVSFLVGLADAGSGAGLHRVVLTPDGSQYNPLGSVHVGILATALEAAMAAAQAGLPPDRACTTVESRVSYARALTLAAGAVTAEGRVVHAGRQVVLAEGRLVDAQGRLCATASSIGVVGDAAGPVVAAPGEHLLGASGAVHAGVLAVLLDTALGCAIHTTLPAGRGYTTLGINLSFLHPVAPADGTLTATGQAVHGGGRTTTSEARMVEAAGRLCATGTTTCLLFDVPPASARGTPS